MTPIQAIRAYCLDCCGSAKAVKWCPVTHCDLWEFRFGLRPETALKRFGVECLSRTQTPEPEIPIEELPR